MKKVMIGVLILIPVIILLVIAAVSNIVSITAAIGVEEVNVYLRGTTEVVELKVLEFVLWAEHLAYENSGKMYHFKSRHDYLPDLMAMNDYDTLKQWFADKISQACRNINTRKESQTSSVVDVAKEYIDTHYQNEISLDDVSREVDISPYYFSKIFKDETGENFIEYLTAIRIAKAKELLLRSEYSMKEICSMVGYSDPNYFSRTFKKNVGVTPTEFKEGKE